MYKSEHIITSKHYMVIVVLSFVSGIFISLSLGIWVALCIAISFVLIATLAIVLLKFFVKVNFRKKHFFLTLAILTFFALGITRVFLIDFSKENSLRKYAGQELWLYGTITSEPQLTSSKYYHTFEFDVFCAGDNNSVSDTVLVYLPQNYRCDFHAGDNVFFWAQLDEPTISENNSSYDYFTMLRGKNIFLTAKTKNINLLTDYKNFSFMSSIKYAGSFISTKISGSIDSLFPDNPVSCAILKGILIGDKSGFDDKMYDQFSNSGISHIVSVSGLHMSILFSFLIIVLGVLNANRKTLLLLTIPFIVLFMAASAFTPTVCRASIMLLIMIFSCLIGEEYNSPTSLFAALGIIIAIAPYAIFSKSLLLSFSATFGIFAYYRYINYFLVIPFSSSKWTDTKVQHIIKKSANYLCSSLSLSIASFLGTAYFLVVFFGKISKVQFFTNIWIIPIVSIIFCLGFVCCIIYYIFPRLSLNVLRYPLGWLLEIVKLTKDSFGDKRFTFNYSYEASSPSHATIYFGAALMIYMFLKAFHDIHEQNKTAVENSTTED